MLMYISANYLTFGHIPEHRVVKVLYAFQYISIISIDVISSGQFRFLR